MLLQGAEGLLQIPSGAICAFPEQNHIIVFKDQKMLVLLEGSCSIMVECRPAKQLVRVKCFGPSVVVAVTGNKWFVVNNKGPNFCSQLMQINFCM